MGTSALTRDPSASIGKTADRRTPLALAAILALALALRVVLLAGPQTEVEADEAIVGLMGRHILEGERPVFYWMQPYMGSLEAYLAAGSFALFGSSILALKLVPLLFSLLFVGLVFATGFRIGGLAGAVVAGLYAALPPAFLALWGLKARGGYVEVLVIGQLLILLAMRIGKRRSVGSPDASLLGALAGIGLWTNPLVGVYLAPIALYLLLALRLRVVGWWICAAALGALVGAYPLVDYNLRHGFETAAAMFGGGGSLAEAPEYLARTIRYSLPILAGLAQASSSDRFFWPAFWASPAALPVATALVSFGLVLLVLLRAPALWRLLRSRRPLPLPPRVGEGGRGDEGDQDGAALLALLLLAVPAAFVLSKFRELVTEPRYLLPIYSALPPLLAATLARRPLWPRVGVVAVVAVLALNLYSLSSLDSRLNLPDTAVGSVASNRAELADHLLSRGLDRVYADYWIAYPLSFESRERIIPSVISGGFNRYVPYAYEVSIAQNPAFVFVAGSKEEADFTKRLEDRQVSTDRDTVSIYVVYTHATPLDKARP